MAENFCKVWKWTGSEKAEANYIILNMTLGPSSQGKSTLRKCWPAIISKLERSSLEAINFSQFYAWRNNVARFLSYSHWHWAAFTATVLLRLDIEILTADRNIFVFLRLCRNFTDMQFVFSIKSSFKKCIVPEHPKITFTWFRKQKKIKIGKKKRKWDLKIWWDSLAWMRLMHCIWDLRRSYSVRCFFSPSSSSSFCIYIIRCVNSTSRMCVAKTKTLLSQVHAPIMCSSLSHTYTYRWRKERLRVDARQQNAHGAEKKTFWKKRKKKLWIHRRHLGLGAEK